MSGFWSGYVIILTLLNVAFCFWIIRYANKNTTGEGGAGEVTGHTWDDDLQELNNPLPRWWLGMFYISIAFSLIYFVVYPGMGNFEGISKWTQTGQYDEEIKQAEKTYGPIFAKYAATPIAELAKDGTATAAGQRLFINYCATCHGSNAKGAAGFPNLTDKDWLYGGDAEAIKASILNGRNGVMPPMGAALGDDVDNVVAYVESLSGRKVDAAKASAGKAKYEMFCAACHQASGKGNPALGAPNLTDNIWLYGGSTGVIKSTIMNGRTGLMPPHKEFLGEDKAHLLAAYIYSLSNTISK